MSISNLDEREETENSTQSLKDFEELTKKGVIYSEIESLWEELLGFNIEKSIQSPEFKHEGISKLIKEVKELVPEGKGKKSLLERLSFLKENQKKLMNLLDPHKKGGIKIRHSGHFIDQKLKYEYPNKNQITIFDAIESDAVRAKVGKYSLEIRSAGVKLTPPEDKLLNALQKLLHQKSQSLYPDSPDYYKGNVASTLVPFGNEKRDSPRIRLKPGELYRAYLDNNRYSGVDIKYIKDTLMNLSAKKFLMKFDRKRQVEKNGKLKTLTDRIEEFQSLIQVIKYTEGIEDSELEKLKSGDDEVFESKGELIIGLNPILVEQINSKYIEYPSDINKRMTLAAGGHRKVTEAMVLLRDYMLRELSSKRTRCEIYYDRLAHQLQLHKYIQARQNKRVEKKVSDAIQAVRNLGLITSAELITGSTGEKKYIFELNPDFS